MPKSNVEFWIEKFKLNVARDKRNAAALQKAGWRCLTIWGCETKLSENLHKLAERIENCNAS